MTTGVLTTKIGEADNKIPDVSGLIKKTDCNTKISDIERKYFPTSDYNKFMNDILDAKIKQKKMVNESNITDLVKNFDLNTKLVTLATKEELK